MPYSLRPTLCSLFPVPCSLFPAPSNRGLFTSTNCIKYFILQPY
ncbi:hypothetical protein [Moorena sp. SIOASIH]|nr:hypothetical protein [Moorena sp. SIOASIH]